MAEVPKTGESVTPTINNPIPTGDYDYVSRHAEGPYEGLQQREEPDYANAQVSLYESVKK